jgi:KTSC domain
VGYLPAKPAVTAPPAPERIVPRSSFLQMAEYDATSFVCTIHFKNGASMFHRYFFPITWSQFKESPSPSSFYARSIKGKYQAIPLTQPLKVSDLTKAKKPHAQRSR